jgi:hypothetical protein
MRIHPMLHLEATHFAAWFGFPMGEDRKGKECICDDGRNPPISGEIRLIENKDYNERITFQNER